MKVLVTGGSGFIGSAVVRHLVLDLGYQVVNIDRLSYAGSRASTAAVAGHPAFRFEQVDICERDELDRVFAETNPEAVLHLAAESHVDRSIDQSGEFIRTNVIGTWTLLEATRFYLRANEVSDFRFVHVSTDEVFGALGKNGVFTEDSPYRPTSPYSASKAASDHLVRAWHHTYGLPSIVTNCSNNYGPWQFPEKLIPVVVLSALQGQPIPVYGSGKNVRDWLFVDDHASALAVILEHGSPGETYAIGSQSEHTNIELVLEICAILDRALPNGGNVPHHQLITYVSDRPGHDHRYAIDSSKLSIELGWSPRTGFKEGLQETVEWYINNLDWCRDMLDGRLIPTRIGGSI